MIEKKPFVSYSLDEEKDQGQEIISLRINDKHREWLDIVKWYLHEPKDATAIKYAIEWTKNDIRGKLSEASWRKICSNTRRKPEMKRPKILENQ